MKSLKEILRQLPPPPPAYGSREWLARLVRAGHKPVGVLPSESGSGVNGLVVIGMKFPPGAKCFGWAKVIGGSPEHPTIVQLRGREYDRVIRARARASGKGASAVGASEGAGSPGATSATWVFGGLIAAAFVGVKALEKRFG